MLFPASLHGLSPAYLLFSSYDGLLVENGEQHELDIDDNEWFQLIWNMIVLIKHRLLGFNIRVSWASFLGQLAQLYG